MGWRQMDPVILIDSYHANNDLSVPITSKPLPALLAPPIPSHHDGSLSSFFSSTSSLSTTNITAVTATSKQRERQISTCSSISNTSAKEKHSYVYQNNTAYYTVIQKQSQEIQDLRQDIIKLNQKYIDQIDRIQIAEQAQFQVESELEDLSLRLFEQANEMVAQEKKARYFAEKKVTQLERELSSVYEELDNERAQLNELREKFEQEEQQQRQQQSYHPLAESMTEDSSSESNSSENDGAPVIMVTSSPVSMMDSTNVYLDDGWLNLFKDFLTLAPNTPLESIHRLTFLKQCLDLDIEPCLRFGNNMKSSRLSTKRVLDAIIRQPCFIESDTPNSLRKRHSHDDRMSSPPKQPAVRRSSFAFTAFKSRTTEDQAACYGCGSTMNKSSDLFRFRLKEQDTEWFWIDRTCRDRLVAVCDFYVFIRHVRSGLQSQRTIQSLFQECVWLRLCMFWARSGVHHYEKLSISSVRL